MVETTSHNGVSRYKRLYDFLIKINLFDDEEELSLINQLLATRIFIVLLVITLSIIIIFTSFSLHTNTITIQTPSEITFSQLSIQYPSTLSCPCQQSLINQDEFISFNPQYHPICTSQFVNQTFISSSLSDMNMSDYWPLDYRIMIASHSQILALFCQTIKQTITDAIEEFSTEYIFTNRVLFHDAFNAQVIALVEQLKTTTVANYKHTSDFLWLNIFQNGIYSGLRTNYFIQAVPNAPVFMLMVAYYSSLNDSCSCELSSTCVHQGGIYNWIGRAGVNSSTYFGDVNTDPPLLFTIPGIMVGCLPYSSLLQSTLECFYNQSCINMMQTFINRLSLVSPLSSSRFAQDTTVNDLLDQLFIESWNNKSNFTRYFQVCSAQSCTYSYDQRFNLLYIIVTIISLFGGLRIITHFSAPYIVNIIRRIQKTKCSRNTADEIPAVIPENINQSLKDRLVSLVRQIYQKIITLNLFPFLPDINNGLDSTRIYVVSLTIGILTLVFYATISVRIQSITVYQPSLNKYESLYNDYPSTLVCPCTDLSISYESIMDVQPRYHQVCSSDFVKNDAWLLYYPGESGDFFSLDFRSMGYALFTLLQTLCLMSNETVTNELTVFNDIQFVSTQVLAKVTFNKQTSALIQQFENQTIATFLSLFDLVRASIQLNQFVGSSFTNAILVYTLSYYNMSLRFIPRADYDNNCSCGTNSSCTLSQGFYCRTTNCNPLTTKPNQTIPGLVVSCLPVDSLLSSSIECFYNISCIQMLIEWYSYDWPNATIDPRVANVTPLNSLISSRFPPTTTLDKIVSQLFVEDWTDFTNFSSYYSQCAPDECTYTYEERFNIAYLISTIVGIVGGLSVALRILIPPVVTLLRRMYHHCCRPLQTFERDAFVRTGTAQNVLDFINQVRHLIQTMNLYRKKQTNQMIEAPQTMDQTLMIQQQKIATGFYIIALFFGIIVVLFFTGFTSQTHSVTVSSPTESTFEQLQSKYSSTLSCPCSQIAIEYSEFLSVEPSAYHQVCSSYFISSEFIDLLWGSETNSLYFWSVDIKILSTQFRLLSSFCSLAKSAIDQQIEVFSSRELISIETLTRYSLQVQIDSITNSFIVQTPVYFRRTHKYIMDMLHANQLQNMFYSNWNVTVSDPDDNYIMSTNQILYNESNDSCSCATSSTCSRSSLTTNDKTGSLSGIVVGCLPIYGLRLSTLECLYDSICLDRLFTFIDSLAIPEPLNASSTSRFTPISSVSIGTLIDELFIETWENASNYSSYFSTCAPLTCQYTYVQRNDAIYILTTFLGLYGGLTIGLKFVVWYFLCIYWKIRQWLTGRQRRIEPENKN